MGFRVFSGGLIFSLVLNGLMSSLALGACRADAPPGAGLCVGAWQLSEWILSLGGCLRALRRARAFCFFGP